MNKDQKERFTLFTKELAELEKDYQKLFTYETWVRFDKEVRESSKNLEGWEILDKRMRAFLLKEREELSDKEYAEKLLRICKASFKKDDDSFECLSGNLQGVKTSSCSKESIEGDIQDPIERHMKKINLFFGFYGY